MQSGTPPNTEEPIVSEKNVTQNEESQDPKRGPKGIASDAELLGKEGRRPTDEPNVDVDQPERQPTVPSEPSNA